MKSRTKFHLGITLMLAAALASAAMAQAAYAQDTTGATGSTNDQKVVFTWGLHRRAGLVESNGRIPGTEFYFWTASLHLPIDFDVDFGAQQPNPNYDGFNSGLVTDVQVSDDSMHYTYTIRDDLFWSDGEPLTAVDVAYTLNLYKNNHAYLPGTYVALIDGDVRAIDDTTIEFDTTSPPRSTTATPPTSTPTSSLSTSSSRSSRATAPTTRRAARAKGYDYVPQVGSGPFVMTEYKVGEFVRMERNPDWPGPARPSTIASTGSTRTTTRSPPR